MYVFSLSLLSSSPSILVIKNGLINRKFSIEIYPIVVEINLMIARKMMKLLVHKQNHVNQSNFLFIFLLLIFFLGQFQQRVQNLMNRQKSQLKAKGQRMPSHSELKKPEQIMKKRTEKRQKDSLQRARQMRKGGRTNYRNNKQSSKPKHARRAAPKANNSSKRTNKR